MLMKGIPFSTVKDGENVLHTPAGKNNNVQELAGKAEEQKLGLSDVNKILGGMLEGGNQAAPIPQ